ncbi:MAG: DUF2764 family protein [Bacteroidales bacterium]|nr:DUF2764 family protein [Bacteroidales bacterium]
MSKYYALVAGLPDLSLDMAKVPLTLADLKELLKDTVVGKDMKLIRLFFLKFDNENLLAYLKNPEADLNPLGTYTTENLESIVNQDKVYLSGVDVPQYFFNFLDLYHGEMHEVTAQDMLTSMYYDYAVQNTNSFVRDFFEFTLNVKNIVIGYQCRKYNFDIEKAIVSSNKIAELVKSSKAKDFGLTGEVDNLETILLIAEENNILTREQRLDALLWNYLDQHTVFEYFSLEKVFAYMIRIDILERWEIMRRQKGSEVFLQTVNQLKENYEFQKN